MDAHQVKRIVTNITKENAIEVCIASMHICESLQDPLQHPAAMVDTLLKDWKQYMATDEYRHDVERARKDRTEH